MKYAAIALHFDSLGEAYGFPAGYKDPSFHTVSERFFSLAQKYNFKYSIYLIGRDLQVLENRECVQKWALQGHEIGNHSWSHPVNLGSMNRADIHREVELSHKIITKTVGYEPKGFVAPAWCTSSALLQTLIDMNYSYDASTFPSWIMYPVIIKYLFNHIGSSNFFKIINRRDFLVHLFGPRHIYRSNGNHLKNENSMNRKIAILPMPTNKFRIACWHTTSFAFGWNFHETLLRTCLKEVEAFYYVVHPADLIVEDDLDPSRKIHLERLGYKIEQKQNYLEQAIRIILESGREIITMEELAKKYQ